MERIEWDANLETGHAIVDAQHRAIFKAFNELLDAMNRGKGRDEVHRTLLFLDDYVRKHFSMEESLMKEFRFPEEAAHRALHQEFANRVAELMDLHQRGAAVTVSVMQAMRSWLLEHIEKSDKRLAKFVMQGH